jgi:hypothetical protein
MMIRANAYVVDILMRERYFVGAFVQSVLAFKNAYAKFARKQGMHIQSGTQNFRCVLFAKRVTGELLLVALRNLLHR